MIKNPTKQKFQIKIHMDEKNLYGSLLSEKTINKKYCIREKNTGFPPEYWGGYMSHNIIKRKVLNN